MKSGQPTGTSDPNINMPPEGKLAVEHYFSKAGVHPFDEVKWETRLALITDAAGKTVFKQENVEVPSDWSQTATNIVAWNYFTGTLKTPEREKSVRALIERVVHTIRVEGEALGYFEGAYAHIFENELAALLVQQRMAFNSPVWYNVGARPDPQCSACFIQSVEDTLPSILELQKSEAMLFKNGSGSGTNFSKMRAKGKPLSGGGTANGPVSFMRGLDVYAGIIKSGGRTRRAAKMAILNDSHPDIIEFIRSKANEERKAQALISAGYDAALDGEAYGTVAFQNTNHSVRVSNKFMSTCNDYNTDDAGANTILREIARAAWECGDPGMQFDDTINNWNPCLDIDRINSSNPCSEYMFLDDSACNLASLNLMKFKDEEGELDIKSFRHAVNISILAQEILVASSSYPTPLIASNSANFRPLGLGYANLGAFLMSKGLAYDSKKGREYAAAITALMTAQAYTTSSVIASYKGPFSKLERCNKSFAKVMNKHRTAAKDLDPSLVPLTLYNAVSSLWDHAVNMFEVSGVRNAQVTVLAPTGTIGFLMDVATTGIEPDTALVKYKRLVGGGTMKLVNRVVPEGLEALGYTEKMISEIVTLIDIQDGIHGSVHLKEEHKVVFDCALPDPTSGRSISSTAHIDMMAAVQPFLSGAISKTVNMPNSATVEEVYYAYVYAWTKGLKAIAIYRDGCKKSQPINTKKEEKPRALYRLRLPDERKSITHKFSIAGNEGYITVGMYPDGTPGEVFIIMAKEGSVVSGMIDCFATATSIALQYGVPLKTLVEKYTFVKFEPSGFTGNKEIPMANSIIDYVFRWLDLKFLRNETPKVTIGNDAPPLKVDIAMPALSIMQPTVRAWLPGEKDGKSLFDNLDSPPCPTCGFLMMRSGSCYKCDSCGGTSGCG